MYEELETLFALQLSPNVTRYLPASITLFADPEVDVAAVADFIENAIQYLNKELCNRITRSNLFVQRGIFTCEEMDFFLTARRNVQSWGLYYSRNGGLGVLDHELGAVNYKYGVVPCSTARHHGVAWRFSGEKPDIKVWLATSRKEGCVWDLDSDIGHESAHAAFAPVPLFAQGTQLNADVVNFSGVCRVEDLNADQFARLAYLFSELAVVAIRGEQRHTQTGLPVPEPNELLALLELSQELMPSFGFSRALSSFKYLRFPIDVRNDARIMDLAAPVMRFLPNFVGRTVSFEPPLLDWYRRVGTA